jgi:hypothetical protein
MQLNLNSKGLTEILLKKVDCGLIIGKGWGLFARQFGFFKTSNCFHIENSVDLVYQPWTVARASPWSTTTIAGHRAHWSSSTRALQCARDYREVSGS